MLTDISNAAPAEQPSSGLGDSFRTVEDLGTLVYRIKALLNAANNSDDREDTAWLVSMAQDEAQEAFERYQAWGNAPRMGRA